MATEATASQKAIGTGELTLSQQLKAAESLQRQRSSALISEWKKQETAARNAAAGVVPFHRNLGLLSGAIQSLSSHLNIFVGERIPLLGGAFIRVTENLHNLTSEAGHATKELAETGAGAEVAGAGIAGMAGPIGIALLAVTALVAGVGALIYELTKKSLEAFTQFGEHIFDLQKKLDLGGQSLGTLTVIAKEANIDIDTLARTVGRMQVNISKGISDPASEAGVALKLLKLNAKELGQDLPDQQLRKVSTALLAVENSTTRARVAAALAGKGFVELKPAIAAISEKWDEAAKKADAFGLVLTQSQIEAAKQYKDAIADIELATQGFLVQMGSRFVPDLIGLFNDIEKTLSGNESSWVIWARRSGDIVDDFVIGVRRAFGALKADVEFLSDFLANPTPTGAVTAFLSAQAVANREDRGVINDVIRGRIARQVQDLTADVTRRTGGGEDFPDKAKRDGGLTEAQKNAQAELEILKTASQDAQRIAQRDTEGLQQQFAQRKLTLEQYTAAVIELAADEAKARQKVTDAEREQANILPARQKKVELARIALQEQKDQDAFFIAASKAQEDQRKQNEAAELALNKQLVAIRDAQREGELQRIQDALSRGAILESQTITERKQIEQAAFNDRMALLDIEAKQTYTTAQRLIEIDNERLESQQRFTDTFKRLTQQRLDAMAAEQAKAIELKLSSDFDVNKVPIQDVGVPPDVTSAMIVQAQAAQGAFNGLGVAISETLGLSVTAGQAIGETLAGAFSTLANAVGQAVHSFILFGKVEGGFRRFAAELIASIAASATVQAVYQLAQGLAWLALNAFFPNPKYAQAAGLAFASAAVFGSIAGVATLAGRAVAGNSFNQQSGTGGGRGGGGSSGSGSTAPGPIDRTRPDQREELHIFVHSEPGPGWHDNIVNTIVRDVQRNGPTRTVIIRTAES